MAPSHSLLLPLTSPVKKLIRYHHANAILHQSQQALSPTQIHPSQDVCMFDDSATLPAPDSDDEIHVDMQTDHEIEQMWTHRGPRPEVIIDLALLADQQGLTAALSTLSASILVSAETMPSTCHLLEIVYGPRPTIPAIDQAILLKPKADSKATMSAQIDELKEALEASLACNDESCDTHDAQAAQLGLAGMLVNKSQIQLVNAEKQKIRRVSG